jgi:hypothetical protein
MVVKSKVKAKAVVKPKKAVKKVASKPKAKLKPTRKSMKKSEYKARPVVSSQACNQSFNTAQTHQALAAPQPIHIYESARH